MPLARTFCVGSHPCQSYRRTSCNGWDWMLLSTSSLKFRQLEIDGANGELTVFEKIDTRSPSPQQTLLGQVFQAHVNRFTSLHQPYRTESFDNRAEQTPIRPRQPGGVDPIHHLLASLNPSTTALKQQLQYLL